MLFAATAANAQKKDNGSVVGVWSVDYQRTYNKRSQTAMDFEQKLSQEKKNKDKRSYEQRLYTFASDGTFSISVPEGNNTSGTWTYLADNSGLMLTAGGGQQMALSLLYSNNNRLGFTIELGHKAQLMYPELHLKRTKK
ncbi:MAG: hypothetical protein AAFV95_28780 [Bacteroidota bacterium]